MAIVIGIVSLILVVIALTMGAVLASVLQQNLDTRLFSAAREAGPRIDPGETATDVLTYGRQPPGFLLVKSEPDGFSGAVVETDDSVITLTEAQIEDLISRVDARGYSTVEISDVGSYRLIADTDPSGDFAIVGLPQGEVSSALAQVFTTVALVTAGGLVLLGIVIALVIRASLRPLRSVADTATRVASLPMAEGSVRIQERVPAAEADNRTEIGQVGAALNTLLDHVDNSLEARQRNEARMRSFVADASHELRTPLASIRGYSELSLRDPSLSENTESALERIQAQSLRMTTLVEDLLLLARLDEGQELVYGAVDLTRLSIESVGDARPAGHDHRWVVDVEPDPIMVPGDEARLHQVVANLLANARTHTPAGTEITVSLHRDGGDAVLRVHDDGPGVDPEIADELFERFSRADRSRARKTGGTGLGLSIARAIVQAHAGSITVHSRPGDTTFEVRLPARPAASSVAEAPEADAYEAGAASARSDADGSHSSPSAAPPRPAGRHQ